jgi:Rrf2 family protein
MRAGMRITAKVDYAVRSMVEIAAAEESPVKGERISHAQDIPLRFLENILAELRHAGLVRSQRGAEGGYWLARPAEEITLADVIRAVEGQLASVRSEPPEDLEFRGSAGALREVWFALRANLRAVLEEVTLADVAAGDLPAEITDLAAEGSARRERAAAPPPDRARARP